MKVIRMKRENYLSKIKKRIISSTYGSVFVPSDFKDIANRETAKKALQRLCNEKIIRRLMRGVYDYPEYSNFLNENIAPSPNEVAQAIARNYGWTIIPFGDTALNILGLSTQVPATWIYVSDGAYKEYEFNSVNLSFKKTTNKEITGLSSKTALIIQALKALGKENVDKNTIETIGNKLTPNEKRKLLNESKYSTSWIYETLKEIAKVNSK